MVNVGKYASPIDPMGMMRNLGVYLCVPSLKLT